MCYHVATEYRCGHVFRTCTCIYHYCPGCPLPIPHHTWIGQVCNHCLVTNPEFGAQRFPVPHDPLLAFPSAYYVPEVPESPRETLFRTEPRYMTAAAEETREFRGRREQEGEEYFRRRGNETGALIVANRERGPPQYTSARRQGYGRAPQSTMEWEEREAEYFRRRGNKTDPDPIVVAHDDLELLQYTSARRRSFGRALESTREWQERRDEHFRRTGCEVIANPLQQGRRIYDRRSQSPREWKERKDEPSRKGRNEASSSVFADNNLELTKYTSARRQDYDKASNSTRQRQEHEDGHFQKTGSEINASSVRRRNYDWRPQSTRDWDEWEGEYFCQRRNETNPPGPDSDPESPPMRRQSYGHASQEREDERFRRTENEVNVAAMTGPSQHAASAARQIYDLTLQPMLHKVGFMASEMRRVRELEAHGVYG